MVYMWAQWLHHCCRLRGPQHSTRGQQSQMAMWSTCGQSGCMTAAVLGVPNAERVDNNHKRLCGPHAGKEATSPMPPWGSATLSAWTTITNGYVVHMWAKWLHHECRLGGPQQSTRGQSITNGYVVHMREKWLHHPCYLGGPQRLAQRQNLEMAMWSTCGQSGYITAAVLGVPNTQRVDNNHKWLCGPHVGKVATSRVPS